MERRSVERRFSYIKYLYINTKKMMPDSPHWIMAQDLRYRT